LLVVVVLLILTVVIQAHLVSLLQLEARAVDQLNLILVDLAAVAEKVAEPEEVLQGKVIQAEMELYQVQVAAVAVLEVVVRRPQVDQLLVQVVPAALILLLVLLLDN
jgi:hypothetical protein